MPRPDWYFYFLFYLLRIFKWPESVFLGTVGVPTISLVLLIMLPFLDRRRTRKLSQRPVAMVAAVLVILSMGVLTWKGATAKEALASEIKSGRPDAGSRRRTCRREAVPGAKLFAVAGCTACHTYDGAGGSNLGAPDLTDIGSRNLGVQCHIKHLICPSCVNPGSPMPPFKSLGPERAAAARDLPRSLQGRQQVSGVESARCAGSLCSRFSFCLSQAAAGSSSRPVWKDATAKEALVSEIKQQVPTWIKVEHLPPEAVPGAKFFSSPAALRVTRTPAPAARTSVRLT